MNKIDFTFRLTPYDTERYLPQVSRALEKRTEIYSRQQFSGLWKIIDKLNASPRGKARGKLRSNLFSIVCLALGVFLFVPGIINQGLTGPLLAGILGILVGIAGLWRGRKSRKNRFDRSAQLLLSGKEALDPEENIEISFFETAMMLPGGGEDDCVLYEDFQCTVETADLFVVVFGTRALILQKRDLTTGTTDAFRAFLSEKIKQYTILSE